jgi:hypothetical protein
MDAIASERGARCMGPLETGLLARRDDIIRGCGFDLANKFPPDRLTLAGRRLKAD